MKKLFFLFIILSCRTSENPVDEISIWKSQSENVTIVRDNWGIPHIYGKTDADVVFGLMYAQCEDDFNRVEVNYINAMGRMAEVEGEDQLYTDLRMKLYIDPIEVKKEYDQSPDWLKKLMDAFADGVNYYLHTHPEVKPKLLTRFEPWMALTFSEGSIGGDIETISTKQLQNFYEGVEQNIEEIEDLEAEPSGSNGFAIAPALSASGNSLFLINPHTSFFFRSEVHMVSEEGLNAYGAVTWGQFFVYQGFNEFCGWMHTSSRADAIDHYAETLGEREGKLHYKYGEEWKPLIEKKILLPYTKDGAKMEKEINAYYTNHGPIIRKNDGKWISIKLMSNHVDALTQSYMRTKAKTFEAFDSNMDLNTNSSNNTVYADAAGNIAYYHGNFIPVRNENFDWSGIVDGSNPQTEWDGLHSVEEMITVINPANGWIQNCNSTPFTSAGDYSPEDEDYPDYMAPDMENPRGLHAVKVLAGKKDWTIDKLIDAAYDSYLIGFEKLIPSLVEAFNKNGSKFRNMKEPVQQLKQWDLRFSKKSIPTSLAVYWGRELMNEARKLKGDRESIYTFMEEKMDGFQKLNALVSAVSKLEDDFGTWKTPWGDINRYQRVNGDIVQPFNDDLPSLPVGFASSRWGSLASFGARQYPQTKKWYGTSGNSFVAFVEFGDKVTAKSILTGGQSGDINSPHFDDQADMYTNGKFKDVNFYKEDVDKNAESTYHPGSNK